MELKYYLFLLGAVLGLALPIFGIASSKIERLLFWLFVVSTAYIIDINFVSEEGYRGSTKGFEVSTTDLLLLALLACTVVRASNSPDGGGAIVWLPPGSLAILCFLSVAALSLANAAVPLFGLFELFKMGKGALIFWCVANWVRRPADVRVAVYACGAAVGLEVAVALTQHFQRSYRLTGTLVHPNSLAMYLNMLTILLLALVLSNVWNNRVLLLGLVTGGVLVNILTFSRGGWLALGLGVVLVLVTSFRRGLSTRGVASLLAVCFLGAVLYTHYFSYMVSRWEEAHPVSVESRFTMNDLAIGFWTESPLLGIGINNFSHRSQHLTGEGLGELRELRGALVHNVYLAYAAETGAIGVLAFVLIGLRFLALAWRNLRRPDALGPIAGGLFGGIAAVYVHGLAEWVFRQTSIFYMFWILAGMLAAIDRMKPAQAGATAG